MAYKIRHHHQPQTILHSTIQLFNVFHIGQSSLHHSFPFGLANPCFSKRRLNQQKKKREKGRFNKKKQRPRPRKTRQRYPTDSTRSSIIRNIMTFLVFVAFLFVGSFHASPIADGDSTPPPSGNGGGYSPSDNGGGNWPFNSGGGWFPSSNGMSDPFSSYGGGWSPFNNGGGASPLNYGGNGNSPSSSNGGGQSSSYNGGNDPFSSNGADWSPFFNDGNFGGFQASNYRSSDQQQQQSSQSGISTDGSGGVNAFRHDSKSSSSAQTVISTFSKIGAQVGQLQNQLSSGSLTKEVASQKMSQLASSFKIGLSQAPSCNCLNSAPLKNSVGGVFSQFTQLLSSMKSQYRGQFEKVVSPLGTLQSSFQSFAQSASSSGVSITTIIPPHLPQLLSSTIPALPAIVNKSQ